MYCIADIYGGIVTSGSADIYSMNANGNCRYIYGATVKNVVGKHIFTSGWQIRIRLK